MKNHRTLDPDQSNLNKAEALWRLGASADDISREISIPRAKAQDYMRKIARKHARESLRRNYRERSIKAFVARECSVNSVWGPAATSAGQARRPDFADLQAHLYQIPNQLARRIDSDGAAKRIALESA